MAVYTHITAEQMRAFLNNYDIGDFIAHTPIAQGIENTNYFLDTTKGRFVFTIFEKRVNPNELPYFLGFSDYLYKQGLNCPQVIKNKQDEMISEINGKKTTIISFLEGKSHLEPSLEDCVEMGSFLADMHNMQEEFTGFRKNDLSLEGWLKIYDKIKNHLDSIKEGLEETISKELDFLKENFPNLNVPIGNIHADLFTDNVFFGQDGQVSGIIDFYFSCTDFLVYDLAITLNAWCSDIDGNIDTEKFKQMLCAYEEKKPLLEEEKRALGICLRAAALRFLLTRSHDWIFTEKDAVVTPKNPLVYLNILKEHLNFTII